MPYLRFAALGLTYGMSGAACGAVLGLAAGLGPTAAVVLALPAAAAMNWLGWRTHGLRSRAGDGVRHRPV
jgi:hypothetical protein